MAMLQGTALVSCVLVLILHVFGVSRQLLPNFHSGLMKDSFSRSSFPDDFLFGASSSAYQYEGAANEGGRGPSIWDTLSHQYPEKIVDHSTGDIAIDFYHRYKEDIQMLKEVGMDAFRFSISWSRLLPRGKISDGINEEGIRFYNNVINELISQGMKPFVTLFHWDVPQSLEDEYGGFLHVNIVNHYREYAELCFKEFGDRVKHWITLNEPSLFSLYGYEKGIHAPGRCSNYCGNCTKGNSAMEPYIVVHHQLLAHSAAVQIYKDKYQISQKGVIGISLASQWYIPKSVLPADLEASYRALDFDLGWILHPLVYGDYPSIMRSYVGKRLPEFSKAESKMLKDYPNDFIGLNYYTSSYASSTLSIRTDNLSYSTDSRVDLSTEVNGIPIGEPTPVRWIFICPNGIRDVVLYLNKNYNNPAIYITENGMADQDDGTLSIHKAIKDDQRIRYYHEHLSSLHKAIEYGANVKGYFAWSLLDDFEWNHGFTRRYGIHYVDYKDGLKRYPKHSALWYKNFLAKITK